jgi:hypothetical protein
MPYIKPVDRPRFDKVIDQMPIILTDGELNYVLTRICLIYLAKHGKKYTVINAIMGVLTCMQHELYRRIAGPYEDGKIVENKDVKGF